MCVNCGKFALSVRITCDSSYDEKVWPALVVNVLLVSDDKLFLV